MVRYVHLTSEGEARDLLKGLGADPYGIQAMLPKMIHVNIFLEGLECKVANIIKQEMLSLGGDAAVARGTVACSIPRTDVVLMGTFKQVQRFTEKIASQPFGLKRISHRVREVLKNIFAESVSVRTARRELQIGRKTLIMGILNCTLDSFSDGGSFASPERAVGEGLRMAEEGADIIDIGGESTRPGSDPVPADEELRRVIPVIREISGRIDLPLSIDTMKAVVAREALANGAEIVNDVSAMTFDDSMAKVVAEAGAAVVLMHMRGRQKEMQKGDLPYRSLRGEIIAFLQGRIEKAGEGGIAPEQIMVDPGLGFGKTAADSMRLIRYLGEFKALGRPIVTGASRKSFIGAVTGGEPRERVEGTAAAVTAAIMNGSRIIRVHDVATMKKVAAMADALNWA